MSDLAMDLETNDLLITNGDLSLVTGSDAIQQDLQQTLQMYLGEWFLDTTKGVPYKQYILVKNPNLDVVQGLLLDSARNVPGVIEIQDFSFNFDSSLRSASVSIVATNSNGEVIQASAQINTPTDSTIEGTPT